MLSKNNINWNLISKCVKNNLLIGNSWHLLLTEDVKITEDNNYILHGINKNNDNTEINNVKSFLLDLQVIVINNVNNKNFFYGKTVDCLLSDIIIGKSFHLYLTNKPKIDISSNLISLQGIRKNPKDNSEKSDLIKLEQNENLLIIRT